MVVAMSCNENWYKYLVVDIYSLLKFTNSVKKIYLLVETEDINDIEHLDKVKKFFDVEIVLLNFHKFSFNYLSESSPNINTRFTKFCLGRLILADLITEDKILYLDTDTIVRGDISHLWDIDISDYYVAGVKDYGVYDCGHVQELNYKGKYINSGVILMNLKRFKDDNLVKKMFDLINTRVLYFTDQDAINLVCEDKIMFLPSVYNFAYTVTLEVINKSLVKIFHFTGDKFDWVVDKFYAEEWYDSEELFYNDILKNNKL